MKWLNDGRETNEYVVVCSGSGTSMYWYKCSGCHYRTTSFNETRTQVLRRFKSSSRRVGDSRRWGSLKMVSAENKAILLLPVSHTTKTIYCRHHQLSKVNTLTLSWRRSLSYIKGPLICRVNQWNGFCMIRISVNHKTVGQSNIL